MNFNITFSKAVVSLIIGLISPIGIFFYFYKIAGWLPHFEWNNIYLVHFLIPFTLVYTIWSLFQK